MAYFWREFGLTGFYLPSLMFSIEIWVHLLDGSFLRFFVSDMKMAGRSRAIVPANRSTRDMETFPRALWKGCCSRFPHKICQIFVLKIFAAVPQNNIV